MTEVQDKEAHDETQKVGRGALYLTMTKLWFMVSGYVIVFGLPRILGEGEAGKSLYGKYGVVNGLSAIINALVVQGTTQAVSRFVGRDPSQGDGVRRAAYRLQAMLGGGLFAIMFTTAPWVAGSLYGDPALATPIRCAAFILLFYAFYSIYLGYLNGSSLFKKQALVDFSYSTLKVAGVLGGAYLLKESLGGVGGAFAGFAAAALCVLLLGRFMAGPAKGPGETRVKTLFAFQTFTMAFTGVATAVTRGDLQVLKLALQGTPGVDVAAGEYTAAQQFSTIPYQMVFAITLVLFPLVSAHAGRDHDRIRLYIRQTTRYASMIAMAIVCLFVACPERTLTILYRQEYATAAAPLRFLCFGYLFYSILFIICSIFTAAGKPAKSLGLVGSVLVLEVLLAWFFVKEYGQVGVAAATALSMFLGLVAGHVLMLKDFGQGLQLSKMARIFASGLVVGGLAHALLARATLWGATGVLSSVGGTGMLSKLITVGGFSVLGIFYLVLLSLTGVLDAEDKARFRKVLRR